MQCVGGVIFMFLSNHIKRTFNFAQNSETKVFHGGFHVGVF
jgi:hypothetical protein